MGSSHLCIFLPALKYLAFMSCVPLTPAIQLWSTALATSPSLLLVTAVLNVGEEQLVEGGTLTFQFIEKYHLVVSIGSWSFTVMQNRSQVKRMVCSCLLFVNLPLYILVKRLRTTFKVSSNTIPVTLTIGSIKYQNIL